MIEERIKSTLDNKLKIKKFVMDDPKKINLSAIEIFQNIFVEILNFNIVRGTFFGIAESISISDWNRQAGAEESYVIAEKEDFRILYVRLKRLTRTAQRYAISSIIREGWARKGEFIVIFYEEGSDIWHLVSPHITEGRTILRRYIVGLGEKHRTISANLAKMDANISEPLFGRVQEAFKLEPVTEKFYEDYKHYFGIIKDHLISLGIKIRDSKRYSHLFLNRLMFIYFIQKKGWIGNNKEFVKWYLDSYRECGEKNRFHEKWLNTLFFNAMNKPPREKKFSSGFSSEVCEVLNGIPYLNGGLFEKDDVDELGIELPDSLCSEVIEDFLENYNFTITEESPFDVDIAVDPAMLGKIYESLIAEEERGKAGIFYTPRIEVDLMCRLALYEYFLQQRTEKSMTLEDAFVNELLEKVIEFLFTPPEEWEKEDTIEFRVLRKFLGKVKIVDPACGSGAFLVGMLNVLQELYRKMGIKVDYYLKENIINNNIYGVDIKDWAVRMAELRLWLALVESEDNVPDIEPILPHFSFKLRVGDSIVQKVGEDFIKLEKIKGELGKDIREDLDKLEKLKERHFKGEKDFLNEIGETQRKILEKYIVNKIFILNEKKRKQVTLNGNVTIKSKNEIMLIEEQINSLKKSKENLYKVGKEKIFVWDLDFPEVMLQGGFDIVIANPPYVKQVKIINQDIDPEELIKLSENNLKKLKSKYLEDLLTYANDIFGVEIGKRSDLYVYFFIKGLELLNQNGIMVFVSSNSWLDVDFGKYLQKILLVEGDIKYILANWSEKIFEESDITTVISVIKRDIYNTLSGDTNFIAFYEPIVNIINEDKMKSVLLKLEKYDILNFLGEEIRIKEYEYMRKIIITEENLWKIGGGKLNVF
ncbi:MAG: Eco57I restriction-modification methylase domain-containing protein [Candidatus Helarchaeota archaeon]